LGVFLEKSSNYKGRILSSGRNTLLSVESQQTFRRNLLPPSSGPKDKRESRRFNGPHGFISQKILSFITNAVRTSKPIIAEEFKIL
jgi:hypothetical protein